MSSRSKMSWLWITGGALLLLWLGFHVVSLLGQAGHAARHPVFTHGGRGPGQAHDILFYSPAYGHRSGGAEVWNGIGLLMVKIMLLAGFTAIAAKASGMLKWTGAALAVLALMSMATPFLGLVIAGVIFLAARRIKRLDHRFNQPLPPVIHPEYDMNSAYGSSYERGKMLDEWEQNSRGEEK
ncbi:hypothetical protein [Paenibacillus lemnae]|uniref:Uncharacterized protein n=1 Tax=Paenibacillus lemnae TaxID=1330551 RepID=A0A848M9J0_PAELE|nr:hypothetical protein [Paenibacillus lemnae]NMO97345.1 hypothetical protein [Paenibacillus lemnae]